MQIGPYGKVDSVAEDQIGVFRVWVRPAVRKGFIRGLLAQLGFDEIADQGFLKRISLGSSGVGGVDSLHRRQGPVAIFERSQARVKLDKEKSSFVTNQ